LAKNFDLEGEPDEVVRAIKCSQKVLKSEFRYLPKYVDFYRQGMDFFLEVSKNETLLREIIGDRNLMLNKGSFIINHLLAAIIEFEKADLVV
jgi:hypothetical protein